MGGITNLVTRGDAYCVVVRDRNGRQRWKTLGPIRQWQGKEKKRELAAEVLRVAKNLREGREASRGPETFERVTESFFTHYVEPNNLRTAKDIRAKLTKHVLPVWAARDFVSIRRLDVNLLLDDIVQRSGPVAADRVLGIVSRIMNWYATRHDDYATPIVRGMRRTNAKERARSRILTDDEIRLLWNAPVNEFQLAFIQLALLTAQRREKISSMRWSDIRDGVWSIPIEKREKGNGGELVLPELANQILANLPRLEASPKVFPVGFGCAAAGMKRAIDEVVPIPHWTLHDLRRTARSLMSRAGVSSEHAERVLGHIIGGVEGIYNRHEYRQEKAHALRALAGLIENILRPADSNIVSLHC
jgi:integrase